MTIINYFCDKITKTHMVLELRLYAVIFVKKEEKKKIIKTYSTLNLATLYLIKMHMEK